MRTLQVREALREALRQELAADQNVFVFGEDVAAYGGLDGVTAGLQEEFGHDRVFDTPIAESGMAGLAVGAALMGLRPVVEMQFTGLITVALDQIANSAAKARYVHHGQLTAPMVVRTITFGKGNVYVAQALEAWVAHVPGLKVVAPSTARDSKGLLISSIRDPDPVVFVEHVSLYDREGPVEEKSFTIPLGSASVTRVGADVTVVAYSSTVPIAEEAADDLASEDVGVEVVDLRTLVPFDRDTVLDSVSKTGRLVIVHEAVRRAGFGAEIAAVVTESEVFRKMKAPLVRVANEGVPVPHSRHLYPHVLPDKSDVIKGVRRVMETD